jgi:DNA-binding CsgD family transcriptional regulator
MTHLRLKDLRRASRLADEAGAAEHPGEIPGILLPGLMRLLDADGAAHHWIEPARRHEEVRAYPADYHERLFDPDLMGTYLRLMHQQPLLNHYAETRTAGPTAISELLPQSEWHRLDIYNEFFNHLEVEDQLAILLTHGPGFMMGLSVTRHSWEFAARERELLAYLRPYLTCAQERVEARHAIRLAQATLAKTPIKETRAIIVLDRHERIAWAIVGDLLKRLIERIGPIMVGHRLPAPLQQAIGGRAGQADAGMTDLWAPFRLTWHRVTGSASERVLLIDEQPAANGRISLLTSRELEVLELAAKGRTNRAIARGLGISDSTVRSHLENSFTKLAVSNRTEAAALLRRQATDQQATG